MQHQNKSLTDSLNPELTRLLQNCRDSRSVSALLETIQRPLFDRLKIEAISLAIVDEPIIYVTSTKPLSTRFKEQIIGHNGRCLPSLPIGRNSEDAMDTLQQVGVVIDPKPIGDRARIAWTGALESRGHLMAVSRMFFDFSFFSNIFFDLISYCDQSVHVFSYVFRSRYQSYRTWSSHEMLFRGDCRNSHGRSDVLRNRLHEGS